MMNTSLEILPSLQEIPHDRKGHQANNVTLLSRCFSNYQLEVSIAESGRLRGWVTTIETTEVKLKGLPAYLPLKKATQLLAQSYLKLHKEAIEILPKGLGGMKRKRTDPSSTLALKKVETWEEEALQQPIPSVSNIDSLVEAIADGTEKEAIQEAVEELLKDDPEKKALDLGIEPIGVTGVQALGAALQVNHTLQLLDLEVLPKGLGGIKRKRTDPSSTLALEKVETWEEEVLQQPMPSVSDINSLVEAIADGTEKEAIRKAVEELLKDDPEKKALDLEIKPIGVASVQALGAALQVNHTLQSLYLDYNEIGNAGAQTLGAFLKVNQTLQALDLENNEIGDKGAKALGAALKVNQSLQLLNLGNNEIGDTGVWALKTALKVNHTLQSLNLKHNQISNYGTEALGTALQINQSLQSLNLKDNLISNTGAQTIATALKINKTLQSLNLGNVHISDTGALAWGGSRKDNQSLYSHFDKIGNVGAQALGAALKVNQSLQKLNLSFNKIGDTGALALGAALEINQSIQKLNLSFNKIGDTGVQALGAALKVNQSLQSLNLEHNKIGDTGALALGAALEVNQSLQSLNLSLNKIGDTGALAIATALKVNQTLQSLNFGHNQIGNTGAQALGAALQANQTLQSLNFYSPNVGDAMRSVEKRVETLIAANKKIAKKFQQQIKKVKNFLQSHENAEGILLQNLPQLTELLQKWQTDSKDIISSLEKILRQSGRTELKDRYRKKLADLTYRLHELWIESFERKVAALSNEYVMGKESSAERNADLGYALYETWLTFLGSGCPNWLEDHLETLLPFGVLLDIAEGGKKKDITNLTDARSLFERVLAFRNKSKDSLFSLTTQSINS